MPASKRIPMVGYLRLDDDDGAQPRLVASRCECCGGLYLDRRNGCARCGGESFSEQALATTGTLRSFTIVHRSAPTVETPYVSVVVALDNGGLVKGRIIGIEPDPAVLTPGLRLRLTTFVAGIDDRGTEAVGFAFEPIAGVEAREAS